MRGEHPTAGELVANNAIHGGFVTGLGVSRDCALDSNGKDDSSAEKSGLSIYSDAQLIEQASTAALLATIKTSLQWLTETLLERGESLQPGQIVLTGSIPSLIPVENNCSIEVNTGRFGSVSAHFID